MFNSIHSMLDSDEEVLETANGAATTADLSAFSYTRFMQSKLIAGEPEYARGSSILHQLGRPPWIAG